MFFQGKHPKRKQTVLIVDDQWHNRKVVARWLAKWGFETLEAQSGQDGLEKATHHHPDLIITDVMMPDMDGFEMTRQIRQALKSQQIPIIAMSASTFLDPEAESTHAGCNAFTPKPVDPDTLLTLLQQFL